MSMKTPEKSVGIVRRRIYLLRHGDVNYFDAAGRPVHPGTLPLNEDGREQAEASARALAEVPLDRAVSSDLVRSRETAAIVVGKRSLEVKACSELREIQPGR